MHSITVQRSNVMKLLYCIRRGIQEVIKINVHYSSGRESFQLYLEGTHSCSREVVISHRTHARVRTSCDNVLPFWGGGQPPFYDTSSPPFLPPHTHHNLCSTNLDLATTLHADQPTVEVVGHHCLVALPRSHQSPC